jgi:hypothetical protein
MQWVSVDRSAQASSEALVVELDEPFRLARQQRVVELTDFNDHRDSREVIPSILWKRDVCGQKPSVLLAASKLDLPAYYFHFSGKA